MECEINRLSPDIVMIHWVSADTIALSEICKIKAPVVIVLHDLWFLLGTAAYPGQDKRYITGFSYKNSRLLDWWLWRRKKKISEQRSICFVAPSKWAESVARSSVVGAGQRCLSIPYPLDTTLFKFDPMKIKEHDKFTILFGCNGGRRNPYKGFDVLNLALQHVPIDIAKKMRLIVFGEQSAPYIMNGVDVEFLGKISKTCKLVDAYLSADMFAFPSIEETMGQTKIEAMACGLPVVAFDRTACPEGIIHAETGWFAHDGRVDEFRDGILWCYERWLDKKSFCEWRMEISRQTRNKYNEGDIIQKWITLYHSILRQNAKDE